MIGDLRAQVAAGWAGSRALERLAAEFSLDSLRCHADEIMRRTEAGMRAGIAALPDGEYHEEMEMEIEGIAEPQTLAVTVRIEGSDVYADFTGTAPQVRRPVNCPINYTRAYVALPLKLVCDPILPNNQGTYEPLHLSVPAGTLLNPTFPAACFWRLSAGMLVSELMFRVLSRIAPDRGRRTRARCRRGSSKSTACVRTARRSRCTSTPSAAWEASRATTGSPR